MKQQVSLDETIRGSNRTETRTEGSGTAMLARYEQRKQARLFMQKRRKKYYRLIWRIALAVMAVWGIGGLILKGYGALKNTAEREVAIMRLEQALKDEDIADLKKYIRIPDESLSVNETTLQPLFAYLKDHPNAYEKLEKDFEKQQKMKHVYIKGLTSKPPIFTIKVYGDRYVFEPTLYFFNIRLNEPDDKIIINGKEVKGKPTKDPLVKKVGPYLPGTYTITSVKKDGEKREKQTKKVALFGGSRVHEVDLTRE
ncbi:hypothetical protein DER53_14590 [Parageobacillus toebii NBRC 107807]|uniref:Membrane protein YvbJ n=2 Tax=Parageobacillus toebii TaxID=153151 RepID=A0A6G9J517_9BACL|nr:MULTISPECIES: hypothetical protein [Bacillaceae]PDM40940.1 hypothetical protein CN643_11330 [Parageobacillus yumthangensis]KYD30453.1 hypothetical protein B4110_2144 [Parageobacillus toebii]MBB3869551.1 putative membrane protein YvbJ [Parageobacillus toebii NBRC 107807]PUF89514.1 hypothetical protein DCC82_11305 [Geobacillus sp. LYN3]QIQ33818.1 hypothetical protein DER53_14590 [Parageobacillus toebii NBRC 107807]